MTRFHFKRFVAVALLFVAPSTLLSQMQRLLVIRDPEGKNAPEEKIDLPAPYPLSRWTQNDRRALEKLDPVDGPPVHQKVTILGTLFSHRVIQILTTAHLPSSDGNPTGSQRKSLLVQVAHTQRYAEIYRLEDDGGWMMPIQSAAIYGSGPNAILATFDPFGREGCFDGYWWFNAAGAHPVDFSPLQRAVSQALPPEGTYDKCWAIHPEKAQLDTWIQRRNPECHACDWMGELTARYRIDHGTAVPVSVQFRPDQAP